jgi:hypothetical protein
MRYPGYNPPNDEPEKDSPLDKGFKLFTFCVIEAAAQLAPDDPWGSDDETQEEYNETHGWY